MSKFKPGDVVWRYTIGLTKCTFDKFVVQTEGQDSPAFAYPFIFYELKADPDDGMTHKTVESALYASEEEARAAMLAEMKSAGKHHEESVLKLAAEMGTHTEEIEHLDYLIDRYENDNKRLSADEKLEIARKALQVITDTTFAVAEEDGYEAALDNMCDVASRALVKLDKPPETSE